MKNDTLSEGKKRMGMVNTKGSGGYEEGSPEEEKGESADEAQAEGDTPADGGGVEAEAQAIVNSIGDNHELCQAVYQILKDKYEGEKKEPAAPKAPGDSKDRFSSKDMPND